MTTQAEKQLKLAILTAGILGLLAMAWDTKANQSEVDDLRGIVLDHLCTEHPQHRRCR